MLVVRVTENVRAVQSSYYSSCPWITMTQVAYVSAMLATPFFALFGWTWFYLSATFGIFTMTNFVFSVGLRMFGLWRERGFGW
jgi:hypothetical protein